MTAAEQTEPKPRNVSNEARELDFGLLQNFVGHYLRLAYEASYDDFAKRLGEDQLKPGYFSMLVIIRNNSGITQRELGESIGRDKSSVAKALRNLEDRGLIYRERVENDRRNYASYLTDKGRDTYDRIEVRALEHMKHLDAVIGPERRDAVFSALRDLIDMPHAPAGD
ncbi:MarR family winged helix-turn-helix transcriptional regulator [Limimaricola cinnabarinus]|jgi:DNA-binding MarR family transcriptional regulator|uniref:MarR family winged helix-turn-helix transcriptional regulator n=1 Tax=Limimaricola cinnabarinus TaxID=1125964 RepID=UPI00248FC4B0|nr:MarR family transcriptional regulator [Limimaricola cinnabarinus]